MNTEILTIKDEWDSLPIQKAAEALRQGKLVVFPTETVYGLGAMATMPKAVAGIYAAKGRPSDNPLIVHVDHVDKLPLYARDIPDDAYRLFAAFAPGPITLVLKKQDFVPNIVSGGLDTVAIRIPSHPIARAILRGAGVGVAAPSANISGRPSPTEFAHVKADLWGKVDILVDGGSCDVGVESTVVSLSGERPKLLRPGGISLEELRELLPNIEVDKAVYASLQGGEQPAAPGMKYRHYAPTAPLVLVKGERGAVAAYINEKCGENLRSGVLCFVGEEGDFSSEWVTSFGHRGDSKEQAAHVFDALRALDATGAERTYSVYPSEEGIGLAVCNRLLKAAGHQVVTV